MADPFEVRMRFTSQLTHLNASTTSASKTASYALRHSLFAEDLHSCILEQLERNSLNTRANIMYFLPSLCELAKQQDQLTYVRMMERDILRIVDLVAPEEGGAANVRVVRKVLRGLEARGFLLKETVGELEEWISGRDQVGAASPSHAPDLVSETKAKATPVQEQQVARGVKLDKRQVEQRIEEDRERHKRAREGIWAVPQLGAGEDGECERFWEETSEVGSDDYEMAREEAEERRECLAFEGALRD